MDDDARGSAPVLVPKTAETSDELAHLGVAVAGHLQRDMMIMI